MANTHDLCDALNVLNGFWSLWVLTPQECLVNHTNKMSRALWEIGTEVYWKILLVVQKRDERKEKRNKIMVPEREISK